MKNVKNVNQFRSYAIRQLKNSSEFLEEFDRENLSLSGRVTQTVSNSTYWNLTLGYRSFDLERYNPRLRDADHLTNLFRYGDSTYFAN
ncbi:MAG: hypothetical protein P8X91_04150, partial [Candidatus Bathyarchaeota archaeon]